MDERSCRGLDRRDRPAAGEHRRARVDTAVGGFGGAFSGIAAGRCVAYVWRRHQVTQAEAEHVFFNRPLVVAPDSQHSSEEIRHLALGRSNEGRHLTIVFTRRDDLLRVVSARPMSVRERRVYAEAERA